MPDLTVLEVNCLRKQPGMHRVSDNLYLQVLGRVVDLIKDDASRDRIATAQSFDQLKDIIEGQGL